MHSHRRREEKQEGPTFVALIAALLVGGLAGQISLKSLEQGVVGGTFFLALGAGSAAKALFTVPEGELCSLRRTAMRFDFDIGFNDPGSLRGSCWSRCCRGRRHVLQWPKAARRPVVTVPRQEGMAILKT